MKKSLQLIHVLVVACFACLENVVMAQSAAVDSITDFFKNSPICGTASVSRVSAKDDYIIVSLTIDPRWSQTLGNKSEDLRARWFAIHCPNNFSPVWQDIPKHGDIIIQSQLPRYGLYKFHCRSRYSK